MNRPTLPLLILVWILSVFPSFGELVDPAPHVEQRVWWLIGEMRADPNLNLVYIVNETDNEIIALNTATGTVDAAVTLGDSVRDGHLEFSIDGSKLYFSTPYTNRLHTFSTGTLNHLASVSLPSSVRSFVIGSDGFCYAFREGSGWDVLMKVDPATGAEIDSVANSRYRLYSFLFRNASGTRIFQLDSYDTTEYTVQAGAMPVFAGDYFVDYNSGNNKDLGFDESLNTLYKAGGGSHGLDVWPIDAGESSFWASGAGHGYGVDQLSGSSDVFLLTGSQYDARVSRFAKNTGTKLHDYHVSGSSSTFDQGSFLDRRIAVTPNGHVVYGKYSGSFSSPVAGDHYVGLIGHGSLLIPEPAPEPPRKSHLEIETSWEVGDMLGDPQRDVVYLVDETNGKLIALNTATGGSFTEVSIPASANNGRLALTPDGSVLYLSTPDSDQVHRFVPGLGLALTDSHTMPITVRSFVIGSDGLLYGINSSRRLTQIDIASQTTLGSLSSPSLYSSGDSLFRDATGSSIYILSSRVERFSVVNGALPNYQGSIFSSSNDRDLSVDGSRNLVFRNAGGIYGMSVWHLDSSLQNFWPYDEAYGKAVCQLPTSQRVFGASGSDVIREFDKDTGRTIRDYDHTDYTAGLYYGDILSRGLEISANGVVTYGKTNFSPAREMVGIIGCDRLVLPRSAPQIVTNIGAEKGLSSSAIRITWNPVPEATSYQIFRSEFGSPGSTPHATVTGSTYVDEAVEVGRLYYYWVYAANAYGVSPRPIEVTGHLASAQAPGAPSGTAATQGIHSDKIVVSWNPFAGPNAYTIFRSRVNDPDSSRYVTQTSATSWEDTDVDRGENYYYWVIGVDSGGGLNHRGALPLNGVPGYAGRFPHAPVSLTATDGTYTDKVAVNWSGVTGATSYSVYRSPVNVRTRAMPIASGITGTSWDDPVAGGGNYYWVKAFNADGSSRFSDSDSGYAGASPAPSPPADVTASDGTFEDRIALSWTASAGASSYAVFRNTSNDSGTATLLVSGVTGTEWEDVTGGSSEVLHYWVKAGNSFGDSDFSLPDTGFASGVPLPPTNFSATDGSLLDKVGLSWTASLEADSYSVYRNTTNDSGTATLLAPGITGTSWEDTTTVEDDIYYYWVTASNVEGESNFGPSDTGFAGQLPDTPTGLSATDGVHYGMVRVTWNASDGSTGYSVYRNTTNDSGTASVVASGLLGTSWNDTGPNDDDVYFYWVKANNSLGESGFSSGDSGYARVIPFPPTGLSATDGTAVRKVIVSWNAMQGASSYSIYRNSANDSGTATMIASGIGTTSWEDTDTYRDDVYFYWAKASNGFGSSDFSSSNAGNALIPPFSATATTDRNDGILVSWENVDDPTSFDVYRSVDNIFGNASVVATTSSTSFLDTGVSTGTTYHYWILSYDGAEQVGISVPASGTKAYLDVTRLGGVIPDIFGDVRIIDGGSSGNVTLAAAEVTLSSLTMEASAGDAIVELPGPGTLRVGGESGSTMWQKAASRALIIGAQAGEGNLTTGGVPDANPATLSLVNESLSRELRINSIITDNGTDVVSVSVDGPGEVVFAGTNTHTGGTTVNGSTRLTFEAGSDRIVSDLDGTGAISKKGAGTVTFTGARIDFSGGLNVEEGKVVLSDTVGLGSGSDPAQTLTINPGTTLEVRVSGGAYSWGTDQGSGLRIDGGGTLEKTGSETLELGSDGENRIVVMALGVDSLIDVREGEFRNGPEANQNWLSNRADLRVGSGASFNVSEGNTVRVDTLSGDGMIAKSDGAADKTMFIGADNGSGDFTGQLENSCDDGALIVTKLGSGTQRISGTMGYTGSGSGTIGMTVNAGAVLINGDASAANGEFLVNSGTLGGTGTIGGSIRVTSTGRLSPGDGGIGTLTANDDLNVSSIGSGKLRFELEALANPSDRIIVNGDLILGSNAFGFDDLELVEAGDVEVGVYVLVSGAGVTGSLDGGNLGGTLGSITGFLRLNGNDLELVVTNDGGPSEYSQWGGEKGLTPENNGAEQNPDFDHDDNTYEFGFDGDPLSASDGNKVVGGVHEVDGEDYVTITFPARTGAVFNGAASKHAFIHGITYHVEGGADVGETDGIVIEVEPARSAGLPALSTGWSYRTFRYSEPVSAALQAFLQVSVTAGFDGE